MDMMQTVLARSQVRVTARGTAGRLRELAELADEICRAAGIARSAVTQTVLGSPGVYDPRNAIAPADSVTGSAEARVLAQLRATFGADLVVENDVDAATLAEQEYGAGVQRSTFAFIWIGTGVGMGLVVDGRLHRGAHGAAGEIGSMPISAGTLEGAGSASAIVRAARTVGMRGRVSARRVFAAAAAGDGMAADVVAAHAELLARAVCAIVTIVDPELVVLGGGIGRAPGLASSMAAELVKLTPVMPQVQVSAMGAEAVVRGCLAVGHELAWQRLTATLQ
jgi:predicted NBD/HSP70 family sugar kinase